MQRNPSWSLANFHRILSEFWLFSHRKRIPIRMQTNFIRIRKNFLLELRHFLRNSFKYRENYVGVESSSRTTAARSMLTFIERFTMLGGIVARHRQPHLWPLFTIAALSSSLALLSGMWWWNKQTHTSFDTPSLTALLGEVMAGQQTPSTKTLRCVRWLGLVEVWMTEIGWMMYESGWLGGADRPPDAEQFSAVHCF